MTGPGPGPGPGRGGAGGTEPAGWQQYAGLLRELDRMRLEQERVDRERAEELVRRERDGGPGPAGRSGTDGAGSRGVRGSGPGSAIAALRAELARVQAALEDQADQLERLARLLRLRRPALTAPAGPGAGGRGAGAGRGSGAGSGAGDGSGAATGDAAPLGAEDPFVLLERAVGHAQRSADLANQAERQARRPRLLPGLAAGPRNLLVYLVTALLGLGVQYPIVAARPNDAPFLVVLVVVPALTFAAGWLVITLFGRSRLPSAADRVRVGAVAGPDPRRRSVRLGLTVSFLAFPALFVVLLLADRFAG